MCDTYSYATFNQLRKTAGGEEISRAGLDCGDHGGHAFTVLGDLKAEEADKLVVADPWPTAPQAVLLEDFFLYGGDKDGIRAKESMTADGVDGMKKYQDTVHFTEDKGHARDVVKHPDKLDDVPAGIKAERYDNKSTVSDRYGAPIFYKNQEWDDEKTDRKREEFRKDLEKNRHLQPDALRRLGIKEKK